MVLGVAKDKGGLASHAFHKCILANLLYITIDTVRTADNLFDVVGVNGDQHLSRVNGSFTEYPERYRK